MKKKTTDSNLNTAYDDVFRTLTVDCSKLLLPVLNEVFGKHYTGREEIVFGQNEHFLNQQDGKEQKRITDSFFDVFAETVDRYLFECESGIDNTIIVRMFEYITQKALDTGKLKGNKLTVTIPNAGVLFLRSRKRTPDKMEIEIKAPNGTLSIDVRVMKVQDYSIDELFEKNLYFLIPFYIFTYEKDLKRYNQDEEALGELLTVYEKIMDRLDTARENDQITSFSWLTIRDMSKKVVEKIANKYKNVKEGVKEVMGGRVLEHEAKTIYNQGRTEGWNEGRTEGWNEGKKSFAQNLFRMGFALDVIAEAAGVSVDLIKEWISAPVVDSVAG